MVSQRVGRPEHLRAGLRPRGREGRQVRPAASTSGTGEARARQQTIDLGEQGLIPLEVRFLHDPDGRARLRRRGALERRCGASHRENGGVGGREGDRGRRGRAGGLAVPGAGPDHGPGPLDGRPLPLLLQLAARRRAPVRHQRPGQAEADRPGVARRRARQGRATPGRDAERRAADAAARLDGRRLYVTNSLYSTLGQPVLSRTCASWLLQIDCDPNGRAWSSNATSSSTSTTGRTARRGRTRCGCTAATARRRSSSDRRARRGVPGRGERPAARAGRRGDRQRLRIFAHAKLGRLRRRGRPGTTPSRSGPGA